MPLSKKILPLIIISQFLCTSLWFAGNSVVNDLITNYNLETTALGTLTSAVQFGFILGTLSFAFLSITDKYPPSKIFFVCALFGSVFNLGTLYESNTLFSLIIFRFLTGVSLAGIYPVGMKIAADYFDKGLGKSLSFLIGALVLGTAFPHLLKLLSTNDTWEYVIFGTSILATLGGVLILLFVPKGPYFKANTKPEFTAIFDIFKNSKFKQAAIGYFGHMWELYTFWTFVPIMLTIYNKTHANAPISISFYSFIIIGSGSISCIIGGALCNRFGVKNMATLFLFTSGVCCLLAPFMFNVTPILFISFLTFWGLVVIADSPLFSTLVATNTQAETRGTALTIVNSIGFAITIVSIQLLSYLTEISQSYAIFLVLAIGPIIGVSRLIKEKDQKL